MDAPSATLDPGVNWRLSQQCTSTQVHRYTGQVRGETGSMEAPLQVIDDLYTGAAGYRIELKAGQISVLSCILV